MKTRLTCIFLLILLLSSVSAEALQEVKPSFVIFAPGFWGSMDNLPSKEQSWLDKSPYPHYRKHQTAEYLTGPEYIPIPQRYQAFGEGPSATKYLLCSYNLMQKELPFWAGRANKAAQKEKVKIIQDWETTLKNEEVAEVNYIYLKYDWRLELPLIEKHYIRPLITIIDTKWPGAQVHFVGHSLGGLVGRYAASYHAGRFASLISLGAPHYGIYEIGLQLRGRRADFNGRWDIERSQEIGTWLAEKFFFGSEVVKPGANFRESAARFAKEYTPISKWLDPANDLLRDGFGSLPRLAEAVPEHAIAVYGLGYGSYDLEGNYHEEILMNDKIGSAIDPVLGPPELLVTGDGRVDPVSARGPFTKTICLGKDLPHGSMMLSSLTLTFLIDRYFFNGQMSKSDIMLSLRRTGAAWEERKRMYDWVLKARALW